MAIATKNQAPLSLKTHLLTFLQGLAIGSANAIPGVSGGTLALVFGIYEKLISSIKALAHKPFWQAVLKFRIAEAFKVVNGGFLSVLIAGALFALLTLARGLEWGFQSYPVYILSFFFGLILASVLPVSRYIKRWKPRTILAFIGGTLIGFVLVGLTPTNLPNTWPFLFFSGALAASAMIVPGISGAFILVLLGNYEYILGAVNGRDLGAIAIVGIGAVMGLLSLSQLLSWLFKRYHDTTLALLAGFMLLLWREDPVDEREVQNQAFASRLAYIVGSAVLILALLVQSLDHDVDPFIPLTLIAMIGTKVLTQRIKDN